VSLPFFILSYLFQTYDHASDPQETNPLQRANFKDGRAGGDSVVGHGRVAAGQDDVGLTADRCGSVGCSWHGQSEAAIDWGSSVIARKDLGLEGE